MRIFNLMDEVKTLAGKRTPTWCSILELVRMHFSEKIPPRKFGKAAPARRSLGAGGEPHR
ncbi:MAG: hypothetical protein A3F15_02610 [Candidatus Wildermuthbacteria bacterium RIFCSPHIGHO2_12_FULL_40_12]|uniref:Uncharacterized protein n=1 Tax=Candidatus Wildermuthbacteria bacterium RIFCSPHIGHO2_12_FULL_40_12 TaxID=1802457 RepID=A0A1G2RCL1_9BACT|nr:MAG: hypothetical protein A3F15_02610 [Candidatus Wildermuthbacteria bacterium RIFCSPHIGHO2_12_FULL_40_12]